MKYLLFLYLFFISNPIYSAVEAARKSNVGLTISGGVSLGAYEAGFFYYLTEVLKEMREILNFDLNTLQALRPVELTLF